MNPCPSLHCPTCWPVAVPQVFGVATMNLWAKACRKWPDKVHADLVAALESYHMVCVQEAGPPPGKRILRRLVDDGLATVYAGPGNGSAGTAVVVRADLPIHSTVSHQLTPDNLHVGVGAGPARLPAKWLNLVTVEFAGRRIAVGPLHGIASAYLPHRKAKAARLFTQAAQAVADTKGAVVIGGDMNRPPGHKLLAPLGKAGLVSTQVELGNTRTHKVGAIDDVQYRQPPAARQVVLTPRSRQVHKVTSDHDAYGVLFDVTPGPH